MFLEEYQHKNANKESADPINLPKVSKILQVLNKQPRFVVWTKR